MNVSFLDLREKEVINVYSGSRLGRIIDIVFDVSGGDVLGIVVPGDKKLFKKSEDIFVPLDKVKRIGSDVILVGLQTEGVYSNSRQRTQTQRKRGNIDAYYENGYISQNQNAPQNAARQVSDTSTMAAQSVYFQNERSSGIRARSVAANSTELANPTNLQYKNQSQSNFSYVRLKPLASKKYK